MKSDSKKEAGRGLGAKDPYAYSEVFFARAPASSAWLRVAGQEPLRYATTSDFSSATPFDSKEEALAGWALLRAELIKKGGGPAWLKGPEKPSLFSGMSSAAPPAKLQLFMGLSQGRFVGEQGAGISRRWCMVSDIKEASVFASQEAAARALSQALPARGVVTGSILPLDCVALGPMAYRDLPPDPLAGAMRAASARFEIEESLGPAEPASEPKRISLGRKGL